MTYFLIAGEASGDMHAAGLIRELDALDHDAVFVGLGGGHMRDAGCRLVQDYTHMAFMGVIAVLRNISQVNHNFALAKQELLRTQPDILILIDYPSFNLHMADFCRRKLPSTRIVWYIPPKIWAWKTWRIHRIARLSDLILGIFPFEPDFYARYGYRCLYVGNPTLDAVRDRTLQLEAPVTRTDTIALLPGSRPSEISHCLPVMLAAARNVAQRLAAQGLSAPDICVSAAPSVADSFYARWLNGETLTHDTYTLLRQARAAVVNSGTATLEAALLGCPQTAVYYIAASKQLGWLKPLIFKTPFFTLVNIIPGKPVIQELVGPRFSQHNIEVELTRLLTDTAYRQNMSAEYTALSSMLSTKSTAAATAAMHIQSL